MKSIKDKRDDPRQSGQGNACECPENGWACSVCSGHHQRPLAVSIKEFCRLTSLCRTSAWALARDRKIEVVHVGSRALVLMRSIDALLQLSASGEGE